MIARRAVPGAIFAFALLAAPLATDAQPAGKNPASPALPLVIPTVKSAARSLELELRLVEAPGPSQLTAKELGRTIPPSLLLRANEVIE